MGVVWGCTLNRGFEPCMGRFQLNHALNHDQNQEPKLESMGFVTLEFQLEFKLELKLEHQCRTQTNLPLCSLKRSEPSPKLEEELELEPKPKPKLPTLSKK